MCKTLFRAGTTLLVTLLAVAPASAQDLKSSLIDDFERQRANVLGMVDAMPEASLRTAPTDDVRDFAQQIQHVVQGNVSIIGSGVDQPVAIEGFSGEGHLDSKEELKRYVNAGFDAVKQMLEAWGPSDLTATTSLFGQATVEKWKLAQLAYEHGVWTLGATVPYVRLAGSAPTGYDLIPGR